MELQWASDFIDWISQLIAADIETLLKTYGYYAILFLTFLEGETIVIIAGMFATKGILNPYLIAVCAFCGSFTSDQLMFSLGRYKGAALLERFPRFGKNVDKATKLLKKYDTALILGFRFVYGVRNVTPILLGISGVSHAKFFILNFIGAAIWAAAFTAGGYFFGKVFEHIIGNFSHAFIYIIIGLALILFVVFFIRRKKNPPAPTDEGDTGKKVSHTTQADSTKK